MEIKNQAIEPTVAGGNLISNLGDQVFRLQVILTCSS